MAKDRRKKVYPKLPVRYEEGSTGLKKMKKKNSHSLLHRLSIFRGSEGVRSMSIFDIAGDSSSHPVRFLSDFFSIVPSFARTQPPACFDEGDNFEKLHVTAARRECAVEAVVRLTTSLSSSSSLLRSVTVPTDVLPDS